MSIIIFLFSLFPLFFFNQDLCAQNKKDVDFVTKSIQKIVGDYTIGEKIKDSTAIYSYAIKINVIRKKDKQIVNIAINNPAALDFFNGLDKLKKVNYLPLMRKKKNATFLFQNCS